MTETEIKIRRAEKKDMEGINELLYQVLAVHHQGRPDLFKADCKKYTDEELLGIIEDDKKPVFVAVDGAENVLGYAFCIFRRHLNNNVMTDVRTLYIDDLCVREGMRGRHIGKSLYEFVRNFAGKSGCYNLTLNVWALNEGAEKFYKKCGLVPQKTEMEQILWEGVDI